MEPDPYSKRRMDDFDLLCKRMPRDFRVKSWYSVDYVSDRCHPYDKPIKPDSRNIDPFCRRRMWK